MSNLGEQQIKHFFVPFAQPGTEESAYAELAQVAGRPIPPPSRRIASIEFDHNGEHWIAEVGKTMRGTRFSNGRRKSKHQSVTHLSDPATVLAIFPGIPYMVVTNARFVPSVRSYWENPFMVGQYGVVNYFKS